MNDQQVRDLLASRGIKVSDEHLQMLVGQLGALEQLRQTLEGGPGRDYDIGLTHVLKRRQSSE